MTDDIHIGRQPSRRDGRLRMVALATALIVVCGVAVCGYAQLGFCAEHAPERTRIERDGRPTRDEFRARVVGMTPEQVVREFGRPAGTADYGAYSVWTYSDLVYDDATDRVVRITTIEIRDGKVVEIR